LVVGEIFKLNVKSPLKTMINTGLAVQDEQMQRVKPSSKVQNKNNLQSMTGQECD
jgi:hypothetical protein